MQSMSHVLMRAVTLFFGEVVFVTLYWFLFLGWHQQPMTHVPHLEGSPSQVKMLEIFQTQRSSQIRVCAFGLQIFKSLVFREAQLQSVSI